LTFSGGSRASSTSIGTGGGRGRTGGREGKGRREFVLYPVGRKRKLGASGQHSLFVGIGVNLPFPCSK